MKKNRFLYFILVITSLIFVFDQLGWLRDVRGFVAGLFDNQRENFFQKVVGPTEEKERLKKELARCQGEVLSLKEENLQARRLLDAGTKPEVDLVLARIVGISNDEILLRITGKNGIKKGDFVISGRSLLGTIVKTDGSSVRGMLLNSLETKLPVKIWTDKDGLGKQDLVLADGILINDAGDLLVSEILADKVISVGDFVGAVSQTGEVFIVGQIKEVVPSKDKVFQEAKIDLPFDPSTVLTVGIIN